MNTRSTLNGASALLALSLCFVGVRSATSALPAGGDVTLQGVTPGVAENGHFNIAGTGIALIIRATNPAANGFALRGEASNGAAAKGVFGYSATGYGSYSEGLLYGSYSKANGPTGLGSYSVGKNGVFGSGSLNYGVKGFGTGTNTYGVWGVHSSTAGTFPGVFGETNSTAALANGIVGRVGIGSGVDASGVRGLNLSTTQPDGYGVWGSHAGEGEGVCGTSALGAGVKGDGDWGVWGCGDTYGGYFKSSTGTGLLGKVTALTNIHPAVEGTTVSEEDNISAIYGRVLSVNVGLDTAGVKGLINYTGNDGIGVFGQHNGGGWGSYGGTQTGIGTYGYAGANVGVNYGGYFQTASTMGFGGFFAGKVQVVGSLAKSSGTFLIDHPQDPANKFLSHSFVESPDMMNVYNGNARTDDRGIAWVEMPGYFESLNKDFRYQLTVVDESEDTFALAKVYRPIQGNRFAIKTNAPNVLVSWQVTGIRQDAWANEHRVVPEENKNVTEKGYYLNPELFGAGEDQRLHGKKWRRSIAAGGRP